jgi:GMP synthase (glutamine-hydrolysing)
LGVLIVVNNGTHFLAEMQSALARLDVEYDLVPGYELLTADVLISYSGVILTGGDVHVYEPTGLVAAALDEQILTLVATPILGICLGHQLIAHHWGATIEALPAPIDRHEVVEIVRDDLLFAGLAPRIGVRVAHDDAVTTLPVPLVRLARSRFSEYEAIRHPTRLVYGLQFHPEASGDTGLTILGNFVRLCSDPRAKESQATAVEGSG